MSIRHKTLFACVGCVLAHGALADSINASAAPTELLKDAVEIRITEFRLGQNGDQMLFSTRIVDDKMRIGEVNRLFERAKLKRLRLPGDIVTGTMNYTLIVKRQRAKQVNICVAGNLILVSFEGTSTNIASGWKDSGEVVLSGLRSASQK